MAQTYIILGTTVHGQPSGNYDGSSQDWVSDAQRAADYYRGRGGLQTVTVNVTEFVGRLVLEATLDTDSNTATWFTTAAYESDSTYTDRHPITIRGNFTWMRVRVELFEAGTIDSVTITY